MGELLVSKDILNIMVKKIMYVILVKLKKYNPVGLKNIMSVINSILKKRNQKMSPSL